MPINAIAQKRVDTILNMKEEEQKNLPAITPGVFNIVRAALSNEKIPKVINCDIRGKVFEIKANQELLKELKQKPGRAIATGIIVTALVVGSIALAVLSWIGIVPAMLTYVGIGAAGILNLTFGIQAEKKFGLQPPRQPSYDVGNLFVGSLRYLINSFSRRKELAKLIETEKESLAERINTFEKLRNENPELEKGVRISYEANKKELDNFTTNFWNKNSKGNYLTLDLFRTALRALQGGQAFLDKLPRA